MLTTSLGIRLLSAYSSLRRLTRSMFNPKILKVAVSRCFDCSGFCSIAVTVPISTPFTWAKAVRCLANANPMMSLKATSMSLLWEPNNYERDCSSEHRQQFFPGLTLSRTQPPAILHVVEMPFSWCRKWEQPSNSSQTDVSIWVRSILKFSGGTMRGMVEFRRDISRSWFATNWVWKSLNLYMMNLP